MYINAHIAQMIPMTAITFETTWSRNVGTTELVVAVQNVADTPPIFVKVSLNIMNGRWKDGRMGSGNIIYR